jgi:phage shock protein C
MQRIIQINIAGRIVPIEEDAYTLLSDYIASLRRQFTGDEGKEIIEDIESRISELFSTRLESGFPAIVRADVQKVIETLGSASDLKNESGSTNTGGTHTNTGHTHSGQNNYYQYRPRNGRLLRNPYDKVIGGVCSGLALYFDIDPVIIRLIMAVLFFTMGIGLIAYVIAWAVIPAAKSPQELHNMTGGDPVTIHDISRNVGEELQDLKKRAEQMSRDLGGYFSRKK